MAIPELQPTSISLLDLLKRDDGNAWHQMLDIYQPLIEKWLTRFGAPSSDVHDLSQTVLTVVVKKLPTFEHGGRSGSFRAWLKAIARNCLLKFWREKRLSPIATGKTSFQQQLNELADTSSELSQRWDREYDEQVLSSVLKQIQSEFQPNTWRAFLLTTLEGQNAADVATELNVTINSVFIAKSRVMARLREVGKHLIE